ncbi:hypothetical protein [Streptomyces aidingensis]|uniref:Uncharacterized protein n=1 Tax=Streptomyces aidingensis TaxID=910347 RepID=A0A1I1Q114_9ACTN|nr:hypothetical protein [Streptomyces aidingensis]SFD15739.1 hypothetical protein SAMN05421773_110204 [Streptomyces aidingensis]
MRATERLRSRPGRLALGAAAVLLSLGLSGPAAAATPAAQDDGKVPSDGTTVTPSPQSLTVTPGVGGAGGQVTVKATCQPASQAISDAFQSPITLTKTNGVWAGTGFIRTSGLVPGRTYDVRVFCANGTTQVGHFTFSRTPIGGAAAGFGGSQQSSDYLTPLAIGGGIAAAGALGYVLAARRRSVGNHYY